MRWAASSAAGGALCNDVADRVLHFDECHFAEKIARAETCYANRAPQLPVLAQYEFAGHREPNVANRLPRTGANPRRMKIEPIDTDLRQLVKRISGFDLPRPLTCRVAA
jgi:hypothetical protein